MAPRDGDAICRLLFMLIILGYLADPHGCMLQYGRDELLHVLNTRDCMFDESTPLHKDILLATDHGSTGGHFGRPLRKRGKRSGALVRFRRRSSRPPLPAILLSNVRSINNKSDEFLYLLENKREYSDCSVVCLTETWLVPDTPDSAFVPHGFSAYRADRCPTKSGKASGGGICLLVNDRWCTDTTVISKSCSPDIETLVINCRPFYSPREFASVVLVGVYIDPAAKKQDINTALHEVISQTENSFPESTLIISGDFNHINLKKTLQSYIQHIDIPTHKDGKTLDHCYTTVKNAYKAVARPYLGNSDHNMILLIPTYKSLFKTVKPVHKTVKRWTEDASLSLQNCLEITDWDMFKSTSTSLDEYTDVVTSYVSFCFDSCIPSKTVKVNSNDKDWVNQDFRNCLHKKNDAFHKGDNEAVKKANYDIKKSIRRAKAEYGQKLENRFKEGNAQAVWNGVQKVTKYKKKASIIDCEPNLPNKLNDFYGRFDQANTSQPPNIPPPSPDSESPFVITETEVRSLFKKQNERKAAGPDGVAPAVLKRCADQLAPIYTDVFNESLKLRKVPSCFKKSIIVPVPKKPVISKLNDYRPVALTSVIMKIFERFVLKFLQTATADQLDSHQFAYRSNRSVDDAVSLGIHYVLEHLEKADTYARVLFIDYSSAFNTIIPDKLYNKLLSMGITQSICDWILDFLLYRPQVVRVGGLFSGETVLSTGAPQGCVLSPLLFTLFTNDCISDDNTVKVIKFSDDTTVEGLITDGNESIYREQVAKLANWCMDNNLELNVSKTKEVIVDFRTKPTNILPITINGEDVEQVDSFKFLGTTISKDLKWEVHISSALKKARQRMFFLRQLNKFRVGQQILSTFYRSVIESVLTFSITIWYGTATKKDLDQMNKILKTASNIIGTEVPSLFEIYEKRTIRRATNTIQDSSHPANWLLQPLPSMRRLRSIMSKHVRFTNSFYPAAIRIINEKKLTCKILKL